MLLITFSFYTEIYLQVASEILKVKLFMKSAKPYITQHKDRFIDELLVLVKNT